MDEYCPLWSDVKILGLICNACVLQKKLSNFYVKENNSAKAVNEDYVRLLRVCNSFPELTVSLSRRNLKTLKVQTAVTKLPRLEASP